MSDAKRAPDLAAALAEGTRRRLERLVELHLPGFTVPRVFAGHPVGPDVRADLAYTLGLLDACGHGTVAGVAASEAIARVLRPIDGPGTNTFFSYRVAETLGRAGRFADHPWLADWTDAERANLAEACDSSAWCALLDTGRLPANYAAVLARCELARRGLGLAVDPALFESLIERTVALLTRSPEGWHDDSPAGAGRYDIYTADLYLFLEPLALDPELAGRLRDPWARGARSAIGLVERVGGRNGAAFPWGRSTGALAVCLTIELGALALAHGLTADADLWLGRAAEAFERFDEWMPDGLIAAHQGRSPYSYRGPARRLQMTLDCLGKLAWSACRLRDALGAEAPGTGSALRAPVDELVWFAPETRAAVWAFRSRAIAFALPFLGSTLNDYLPAPHGPGWFEVPVEIDLPTGVPFAVRHGQKFVAGGLPASLAHAPGRIDAGWDGWKRAGEWDCTPSTAALAGSRSAAFEVRGGRLVVRERLHFADPPDGLALQVAECEGRRLRVAFACSAPHSTTTIDTAGIKEYRSFWGELPRVHQIDIAPERDVDLAWTVAPVLRVATTASAHHYNRCLYDPLAGRVEERQFPYEWLQDPDRAEAAFLRETDVFHLHWPEWISHDAAAHRRLIERLRDHEVRILWTQHNLVPHSRDPALAGLYEPWARAADAVVHHSRWGEGIARGRHRFRGDAIHRVIPHPHFGHLLDESPDRVAADRAAVERDLSLRPCTIRLGVVGAPRPEKDVQLLLDAFAACRRKDLGLLVLSLGPHDVVPDDERIRALPYEMVDRREYDRRLAAIDALVFPIREGELLTSGVVGDAIAAGLPSLVSDWPYLAEALGEGAIVYGRSAADLTRRLETVSREELAFAAGRTRDLRARCSREHVAELTLDLLDELGTAKL